MRNSHSTILRISAVLALCSAFTGIASADANNPPAGWRTYRDQNLDFSISYPRRWTVDKSYVYAGLGPDREIRGVAFRIPPGLARGTNLSSNLTAVSLESVNGPGRCEAGRFLSDPQNVHSIVENGTTYSTAQSEDAGAGNFYSETVFALVGSSPCLAIRYFIHSTNIANYDPGTIRKFDHVKLEAKFDQIRRTLFAWPPAHPQAAPR